MTAVLSGLILIMSLVISAKAEAADRGDRRIIFEENRIYAGIRVNVLRLPQIERLTEDAPAKTKLVWQSSNPAVAEVNSWGKVTTLTPGGTLITAQAEDNAETTGSYELYVVWPAEKMIPEDPETTLTLEPTGTMDETDLFYTYQPSDAWLGGVRWSTSKETVATVDETGHVSAVAPGDAVITVEAVMPQGCIKPVKASFRIHVVREAEALSLSEESVDLRRFKTCQLKAEITPADAADRKVVWTSSDPGVAEVLNGRIKAVKSGTCEIRCASEDGRLNASCRVTVTWPTSTVKLSKNNMTLMPGETFQVNAKVYPADADDTSLIWSSSNDQIASVDNTGTVTALLGGDCVISCTPRDGIGTGAECRIHVRPFSIAQTEWTAAEMTGIIIPVQWHSFEPVALELKTNTACFRAIWDKDDNISIQPLKSGSGTLTVQPAGSAKDGIELKITVTENAVTNPEEYPRLTYEDLLKDEPENGTNGKILGKILQRIEQPGQVILLVGTAGEDWGREVFWVEYDADEPVKKAAEGDLVIVCGSYQGVYTYENATGGEISVPALRARQIMTR